MNPAIINENLARNVLKTVDAGLVSGIGKPVPGEMCVEAAICYAMGLSHGDVPSCVGRAPRALKIELNDFDLWPSPSARANGLRRLAIASLGSAGAVDDAEFARRVADIVARKYLPRALRHAAALHPDAEHRAALEAAAKCCETEGIAASEKAYRTAAAALAARMAVAAAHVAAARAARMAEAAQAARVAARAAAHASRMAEVAWAAAEVTLVAADASRMAEAAQAARVAVAAASQELGDPVKTLSEFAEDCVQILVDLNSPGCAYLHLTEV